jgi:hypothetical protein
MGKIGNSEADWGMLMDNEAPSATINDIGPSTPCPRATSQIIHVDRVLCFYYS